MKAPDFDYVRPGTLGEALTLLDGADRDTMPLAGGQSLMPMLNFRLASPDLLVDLNGIDELTGIADEGETIVIGSMTRHADIERSELVAAHLPLLTNALPTIAHPAVRNRGTIGGSVALADPAAEVPALLLALNATIVVTSQRGGRNIAADDFFLGLYETALKPGEIVKAVSITKAAGARVHGFAELSRRHGDYAMVGLAATAASSAPLEDLRLAFFGIADRAIRAVEVERALNGETASDERTMTAAKEAIGALSFHGDLHASASTRRHLAGVLLKRVLEAL